MLKRLAKDGWRIESMMRRVIGLIEGREKGRSMKESEKGSDSESPEAEFTGVGLGLGGGLLESRSSGDLSVFGVGESRSAEDDIILEMNIDGARASKSRIANGNGNGNGNGNDLKKTLSNDSGYWSSTNGNVQPSASTSYYVTASNSLNPSYSLPNNINDSPSPPSPPSSFDTSDTTTIPAFPTSSTIGTTISDSGFQAPDSEDNLRRLEERYEYDAGDEIKVANRMSRISERSGEDESDESDRSD